MEHRTAMAAGTKTIQQGAPSGVRLIYSGNKTQVKHISNQQWQETKQRGEVILITTLG